MEMEDGARKFSLGLLDHYEPPLKKVEKELSQLIIRQDTVLKEIENENDKFKSVNMAEVNNMFTNIKDYQLRLLNLKKEMTLLTERSSRLKKRALRLQEYKQKEALENAHYREAQLKREQDLIARPNKSRQGVPQNNK